MDDEDRYTRITLRIPKDLHKDLSDAADRTSKSLNAEIVGRLSESIATTKLLSEADPATVPPMNEVLQRVRKLERDVLAVAAREDLMRLQHVIQSLTLQQTIHRNRAEREREQVMRTEVEMEAAEDRGDTAAARRLRSKARDERKLLKESDEILRRIGEELELVSKELAERQLAAKQPSIPE